MNPPRHINFFHAFQEPDLTLLVQPNPPVDIVYNDVQQFISKNIEINKIRDKVKGVSAGRDARSWSVSTWDHYKSMVRCCGATHNFILLENLSPGSVFNEH
jgi:hypothetical protein